MDIEDVKRIEVEEGVTFSFKPNTKTIVIKGEDGAVARALARIGGDRDEVAGLLRKRQGIGQEIVRRRIPVSVESKEAQRTSYIRWFSQRPRYYHPTEAELDKMFSVVEEGDKVYFDFARSVTVLRRDGRLVSIDRKGREVPPSPWSPAVQGEA